MATVNARIVPSKFVGCTVSVGKTKRLWIVSHVAVIEAAGNISPENQTFCLFVSSPSRRAHHKKRSRSFTFHDADFEGESLDVNNFLFHLRKPTHIIVHLSKPDDVVTLSY